MKRILVSVLIAVLFMTVVVFASGLHGSFEGLPIVKVTIDGNELNSDVPGVVLNGRTMLPVRAIAEEFGANIKWNSETQTVEIEKSEAQHVETQKPEVQLIVIYFEDYCNFDDFDEPLWVLAEPGVNIYNIGTDHYLAAYFHVGPMPKQVYTYRIALFDPSGDIIKTSASEDFTIDEYGLHGTLEIDGFDLRVPGNYKLHFQMKLGNGFETVTTTTIIAE